MKYCMQVCYYPVQTIKYKVANVSFSFLTAIMQQMKMKQNKENLKIKLLNINYEQLWKYYPIYYNLTEEIFNNLISINKQRRILHKKVSLPELWSNNFLVLSFSVNAPIFPICTGRRGSGDKRDNLCSPLYPRSRPCGAVNRDGPRFTGCSLSGAWREETDSCARVISDCWFGIIRTDWVGLMRKSFVDVTLPNLEPWLLFNCLFNGFTGCNLTSIRDGLCNGKRSWKSNESFFVKTDIILNKTVIENLHRNAFARKQISLKKLLYQNLIMLLHLKSDETKN